MCILSVHTLLKAVGYYGLSVLSMSVMGFQKKFGWGRVGGVSAIKVFFWIFGIFLTLQSPLLTNTFSPTTFSKASCCVIDFRAMRSSVCSKPKRTLDKNKICRSAVQM